MNEKSARLIEPPTGYTDWLSELKTRIHTILKYMRAFAEAWPDAGIVQQVVGQLPRRSGRMGNLCRQCLHNCPVIE